VTDEVLTFEAASGCQRVLLDQCMFQAPSKKATCITANARRAKDLLGRSCCHSQHEKVLIGLEADGSFKTTAAAHYPPELCEALVEMHYHELLECASNCEVVPGPELREILGGALRECPERASHRSPVRPAGPWIDEVGQWKETLRVLWRESEVSNVVESRMLRYALRHAARSGAFHGKRIMLFTDNLAALSIVSRGRSSAVSLRFVCRGVAAYSMGCNMKLLIRWVQSRRNHADGPSRQQPLGYYSVALKVKPPGEAVRPLVESTKAHRAYHG
jgi:hypothetical protein